MARSKTNPDAVPFEHAHRGGFVALDEQGPYDLAADEIEGNWPADLNGTLFRNGPGRNSIGPDRFAHWFDGDGMVQAFSISEGRVRYGSRYVQTPKYRRETKAGRILFRGFGTQAPGGIPGNFLKQPENAANTSLVQFGDRLLALWEGGRPWQLDARSLATEGESDLGGKLLAGMPFSAHGKRVRHRESSEASYWNFGVKYGLRTSLHLYEVSQEGSLMRSASHELPFIPLVHDFACSDEYAAFFLCPLELDHLAAFVTGARSLDRSFTFHPEHATLVWLVRLSDFSLVNSYTMPAGFVFHVGNAFTHDDAFYTTAAWYADYSVSENLRDINGSVFSKAAKMKTIRLPLAGGPAIMTDTAEDDLPCEFPVHHPDFNGRRNRNLYALGVSDKVSPDFFNAVQQYDLDEGTSRQYVFDSGNYLMEAVFVPRKGGDQAAHPAAAGLNRIRDDRGWLLTVVYNSLTNRSELVVLDASNIEAGPVARARLRHHIPYGFHGIWAEGLHIN